MSADVYTFWSPSAGDWVTKCASCGAWWSASHRFPLHCQSTLVSMCGDCGSVEDASGDCVVCSEGAGVDA